MAGTAPTVGMSDPGANSHARSLVQPIRWGILGTGYVARQFAEGLRCLPDAELVAVGSRSSTSARAFARSFRVPDVHASYEDLISNGDVDAVYIATPNTRHKDDCIACLQAGKAVLCEKPFTINAKEAREVIAVARQNRVFCMEAMWMRFIPLMQRVRALIQDGAIGDIRMLIADFGIFNPFDPQSRCFNLQLGGGALLDLGVYPLSLAFQLLGIPSQITSQASIGTTGVDECSAILLSYPQGQLAVLYATLRGYTSTEATIVGTKGQIRICTPLYRPYKFSLIRFRECTEPLSSSAALKQKLSFVKQYPLLNRLYLRLDQYVLSLIRKPPTKTVPYDGNGYQYEAAEVMRCLRSGKGESETMPLDETLGIMETMDTIRCQWNLTFPQD